MFLPESQNLYLSFISQENRSSSNAQILRILNSRFALEHNLRFALEHNSNTTRTQLEHNTNTTGTKKGNREFNYKTYFHESRGVGELRYNNQCDVRSYVVFEREAREFQSYHSLHSRPVLHQKYSNTTREPREHSNINTRTPTLEHRYRC